MKIANDALVIDVIERTKLNISAAKKLQQKEIGLLNKRRDEKAWNALECIEHLNRYSDFYIKRIENQIKNGRQVSEKTVFKCGVLGNYFTKMLAPKEKLNKIKTLSNMNPINVQLELTALQQFIADQEFLLELLKKAKTVDLRRAKTNVTFTPFLKLRLGDIIRIVVYHNQRHIQQAIRAADQ